MKNIYKIIVLAVAGLLLSVTPALANNVGVANVSLQSIDTVANTVQIKFDLSQNNAFGDLTYDSQAFSDYIWVTIKYGTDAFDLPTLGYKHATLASGGTITPSSDNLGAFVKSSNATTNMTLVWNYGADSVADSAIVTVKVLALEMVQIPTGQFTYNAGGIGTNSYNNYGAGSQTDVTSASSLPTGVAAGWPNGYSSFYLAKYEVSQGQWADFLNMLGTGDGSTYFANQTSYGNTVTYTAGNAYGSRYAATVSNRANNYMSWADAEGYAAWLATRPMTEMEFEKASRGTNIGGTNTNTYPWGGTDPTGSATYTYNDGSGNATLYQYYANFSGGPGRPIDVGHYLRGDIARTNAQTGASPYGVADMSGNLWEHLINCAWTQLPANGVGTLTAPASWPTAASGKGIRGGNWDNASSNLRVSARDNAGWTSTNRYNDIGFRPARTN